MTEYSDPYQSIRMIAIWPVLVGCVAFFAVRFIASTIDGKMNRWQAILAGVCGIMAGIVTITLARNWNGSDVYWLAFTIGLGFAALVLMANVAVIMLEAPSDG